SGAQEDVAYSTRVIKDSARRASALIKDLLAWSRITNRTLDRQPLPLATVVREIVGDVLAARPQEAVELIDEMADLTVDADAIQVRQLAENLLVNALKYRSPERALRLVLRLKRVGKRSATLEIEDNGIGFDPLYARQIFEPFRRLHSEREYSGTGVGLAICARVCEHHGWTIDAIGRPGQGATFRVHLTLGPGAAATADA
ncbi:MAG TPA: ATP-binding protein, partial [Methylomirabilota bacterium]|nr:ATP-binding protein [Methylomirabilota bacterium]